MSVLQKYRSHNTLSTLPAEIREMIFNQLSSTALVRLVMTNSNIKDLISVSTINDKFNDEIDNLEEITANVNGRFEIIKDMEIPVKGKFVLTRYLDLKQIVYPHPSITLIITVGSDNMFGLGIFTSKRSFQADTKYGFTLKAILDFVIDQTATTLNMSMGVTIKDYSRFGGLKWDRIGFDIIWL